MLAPFIDDPVTGFCDVIVLLDNSTCDIKQYVKTEYSLMQLSGIAVVQLFEQCAPNLQLMGLNSDLYLSLWDCFCKQSPLSHRSMVRPVPRLNNSTMSYIYIYIYIYILRIIQ